MLLRNRSPRLTDNQSIWMSAHRTVSIMRVCELGLASGKDLLMIARPRRPLRDALAAIDCFVPGISRGRSPLPLSDVGSRREPGIGSAPRPLEMAQTDTEGAVLQRVTMVVLAASTVAQPEMNRREAGDLSLGRSPLRCWSGG